MCSNGAAPRVVSASPFLPPSPARGSLLQPPGTLAATSLAARGTDGAFLGQPQQSATRPAGATPPPPTGQPERFPKARRVRRRGEFSAVFESGTRLHGRFFTFLLLP